MAVFIDIDREGAQIVDVVVGVVDVAKVMLRPVRGFVPVLARDDVEFAVAVDIADGGGLTGTEINGVLFEGNFRWLDHDEGEQERRSQKQDDEEAHGSG